MLTIKKDKYKAKNTLSNKSSKFHYIFNVNDKNHVVCVKPAKQRSVESYVRFMVVNCDCDTKKGKCNYFSNRSIFLKRDDLVFKCGCGINKLDALEHILGSE